MCARLELFKMITVKLSIKHNSDQLLVIDRDLCVNVLVAEHGWARSLASDRLFYLGFETLAVSQPRHSYRFHSCISNFIIGICVYTSSLQRNNLPIQNI